ncbi:lipase family protein [Ectobacillus antri]|jgi:triacylglycerol lipase|uniref:Lipase family protein n=1 Tax=Ectobacillus antri TaxID=2486280 RepID=A0ABT6H4B7_9BACI|nr:lipase family protein [Ectobacillus antri]MDG4656420.1 lipase family protein [Ectobacillus antri]MDG5753470.1 lipase family protein [Ectobacillus antri]
MKKEAAALSATCCALAYEQFNQNGVFQVPEGFTCVKSFQANSMGQQEWFGFILESENKIIVSFRGTQSDPNWVSDSLVNQRTFSYGTKSGLVHHGFLSIYETCRDTIMDTLLTLPNKSLLVTGHSLGGALATLHILDARLNTSLSDVTLYTFGAPKVGDLAFRNFYQLHIPNSFRFVNLFDVVPLLPPRKVKLKKIAQKEWEYTHVPNSLTFASNLGSVVKNHHISTYLNAVTTW